NKAIFELNFMCVSVDRDGVQTLVPTYKLEDAPLHGTVLLLFFKEKTSKLLGHLCAESRLFALAQGLIHWPNVHSSRLYYRLQ
ncbi:MAG: hypothetical protein KBD82_18045, partial [Rhodoferax sp.]|uniref:hypothetical protein n=1 Tax=Rhodoferax sp. TaxID=50421 RepID=UPI001B77F662